MGSSDNLGALPLLNEIRHDTESNEWMPSSPPSGHFNSQGFTFTSRPEVWMTPIVLHLSVSFKEFQIILLVVMSCSLLIKNLIYHIYQAQGKKKNFILNIPNPNLIYI